MPKPAVDRIARRTRVFRSPLKRKNGWNPRLIASIVFHFFSIGRGQSESHPPQSMLRIHHQNTGFLDTPRVLRFERRNRVRDASELT